MAVQLRMRESMPVFLLRRVERCGTGKGLGGMRGKAKMLEKTLAAWPLQSAFIIR